MALLISPIDLATQHYNLYKQTEASAERVFELMNLKPTLVEQADAIALPAITGKVDYDQVSFGYVPNPYKVEQGFDREFDREWEHEFDHGSLNRTHNKTQTSEAAPDLILSELNLKVHPGEVIALVGPSGAGKTTIVNLLMRFYDPQAGRVLIDGIDIKNRYHRQPAPSNRDCAAGNDAVFRDGGAKYCLRANQIRLRSH